MERAAAGESRIIDRQLALNFCRLSRRSNDRTTLGTAVARSLVHKAVQGRSATVANFSLPSGKSRRPDFFSLRVSAVFTYLAQISLSISPDMWAARSVGRYNLRGNPHSAIGEEQRLMVLRERNLQDKRAGEGQSARSCSMSCSAT